MTRKEQDLLTKRWRRFKKCSQPRTIKMTTKEGKLMKKLLCILLTITLLSLGFTGCQTTQASNTPSKTTLRIGLIQFVEHTSLDEIREAFTAEIEKLAKEKNISVEIDYKNAQGDTTLTHTICRTFVESKVSVIVAIATPSAQAALAETTEIPIVFSAVTDPIATGLLENFAAPEGNITGVSDAIDVEKIFALAEELTPDVQTFGLIYNKMEVNSVSVIADVKAYLETKNISFIEKIVANSSEVELATKVLLEDCDAIFVPIDNTVASAMTVLANVAIDRGVPVYTAADSMVQDGGLATVGVNYTQLGERTARMTMEVLGGAAISSLPVQVMDEVRPVVNKETAQALGISVEKYSE